MQPCSKEMQDMNSLLNSSPSSQLSLQDHHRHLQLQPQQQSHSHSHSHSRPHLHNSHSQMHPQIPSPSPAHFDSASHDDFLEQMLSTLGPSSCSWADDTPPSNSDNVVFTYDDSANLATKFRSQQISAGAGASKSASTSAAAAAAMMLQHQLMMSRSTSADSGFVPMALSLGNGDFDRSNNDVVEGSSSFKSPNPVGGEGASSVQALFNGFSGSLHGGATTQSPNQHFHQPQGGSLQAQNYGGPGAAMNQGPASGSGGGGGAPAQARPRVRARRGQATDPHSIAERLRRERIAERMKALQELVPNANKTDKASMLDEIIDYVKFLQLQVKVLQKEGVSERDVGSDRKEKRSGRDDVDGKSSRPRHGTSPSDRQRRSRHIPPSPQPAGVTRDVEKVIENDSERNHGRGSDRRMQREKGSDRETDSERVERRSGKDSTDHRSSRTRHGRSTSPLDRDHKNRQRSLSPQQAANTRARDEVPNSREDEHRDDENDAVAMMKAAEEALEAKQKEKPSFELSGKLAAETNRVRGITLLFTEPPDGRKPDVRWRLYVFKGGEVLNEPLYIHRQSCYLFGRERRVADVPTDHPSCSKQHAVIQFRQVEMEQPDGTLSKKVRPYLMDLGSTNKTFLNDTAIEPQRYYELMEKDTIRFGNSSREYVLLHENSMN